MNEEIWKSILSIRSEIDLLQVTAFVNHLMLADFISGCRNHDQPDGFYEHSDEYRKEM